MMSSKLYKGFLAYALVKGAARGVARAFWRKTPLTTTQADAVIKSLYAEPMREALSRPSLILTLLDQGVMDKEEAVEALS